MRSTFILTCVLLAAGELAMAGQQPKYGVTVSVSKAAGLAKAKTYSWQSSQPSPIKEDRRPDRRRRRPGTDRAGLDEGGLG